MFVHRCGAGERGIFPGRKNYDTRFGSFQMDLRDGEVLYKTELIVADGEMTPDMFRHILDTNWYMIDHSLQDLMAVAFGGADPAAVGGAMEVEEAPEGQKLQ
ncbi:MAG: type III secretion system chaperone family protein [Acidiferrobacteraceae bacterium]